MANREKKEMNPVFYLLIIIAAIVIWLLLSFVFYPLGKMCYRIWKDAIDEINRKDENKETKNEG